MRRSPLPARRTEDPVTERVNRDAYQRLAHTERALQELQRELSDLKQRLERLETNP